MPQPIKRIEIDFIDQSNQRYPTVGDWLYDGDTLILKISRMPKPVWEQAIAVHELVEALLCNVNGVSQQAVDEFDMGPGADLDEPGFDRSAPYHREHCWADVVERAFVAASGESWATYDAAVGDHGCEC